MHAEQTGSLAARARAAAGSLAPQCERFLADLISIRSYTGQEGPAVERTLQELRAIGCDEVWQDSAGNALGRIGRGKTQILYNAHLDTNEVAGEQGWPHPPLEPAVRGETMYRPGRVGLQGRRRVHRLRRSRTEGAGGWRGTSPCG